jgi:hypothetical protein
VSIPEQFWFILTLPFLIRLFRLLPGRDAEDTADAVPAEEPPRRKGRDSARAGRVVRHDRTRRAGPYRDLATVAGR